MYIRVRGPLIFSSKLVGGEWLDLFPLVSFVPVPIK